MSQQGILFNAYVSAIMHSLDDAMPELKKEFGESLTLNDVVDKIGTLKLMNLASTNQLKTQFPTLDGTIHSVSAIPDLYRLAVHTEGEAK